MKTIQSKENSMLCTKNMIRVKNNKRHLSYNKYSFYKYMNWSTNTKYDTQSKQTVHADIVQLNYTQLSNQKITIRHNARLHLDNTKNTVGNYKLTSVMSKYKLVSKDSASYPIFRSTDTLYNSNEEKINICKRPIFNNHSDDDYNSYIN